MEENASADLIGSVDAENGTAVSGARGQTVARVVEHMRNGILRGLYAPGQRLIEADITGELGVGRGSLREAYRQLSAEGLVELVSNRGTLVRRFTEREIAESYEIRTMLELRAAGNAAAKIDEAGNRSVMVRIAAKLAEDHSGYSRDQFFEENRAFHETVAKLNGNHQLAALIRQMQLPIILFRLNRDLAREISMQAVAEHREIATAILAGDVTRSETAMSKHLQSGIKRLPIGGKRMRKAK